MADRVRLYAGTQHGLHVWRLKNGGCAAGSGGAGQILITHDRGESWQKLNIDLPADRVLWAAPD